MRKALCSAASLIFWLAVWQCVHMAVGENILVPSPLSVFERLFELCAEKSFWISVVTSLFRVLSGLVSGTVLGLFLAVLTARSSLLRNLFNPALYAIKATPVASFILLVFLWTDRDQVPVIISALMVLPVVWGNVVRGIRECDPKLLEFARAYRFSRMKTARLILLPAVRPYFLSAVTTSMGLAWKSGVAAEALVLPKLAIGTQIYNTKFYFETADLFAWTVAVILLSLTLEKLIAALIARVEGRSAL